jgi:hypothetical protein
VVYHPQTHSDACEQILTRVSAWGYYMIEIENRDVCGIMLLRARPKRYEELFIPSRCVLYAMSSIRRLYVKQEQR